MIGIILMIEILSEKRRFEVKHQGLILILTVILTLIVITISFLRLNYVEKKRHFVCSNCKKNLKI